jgi:hypothetical protein
MTVNRKIAMWSGPRNISTALMRAWENRSDTVVCDEPLYAHYLYETGLPHAMSAEVIASQPTDWREVAAELTRENPESTAVYYQKHMAHHLLPEVGHDWIMQLSNCFLIREPKGMLPSLDSKLPKPRLEETALPQQVALFHELRETTGETPPVIDSRDVLEDPRGVLGALCERLDLPFEDAMLSWPAGRRASDGVWASHWYGNVEKTTGFGEYRPNAAPLPEHLAAIYDECLALYETLFEHRITA